MCRDCYQYGVDPAFMPALHRQKNEMNREGSFWDIVFGGSDDADTSKVSVKNEPAFVEQLVKKGRKDENDLTNQVYFQRHPELGGRKLQPTQPGFDMLSKEWVNIRDTLVRPILRRLVPRAPSNYELDSFMRRARMLIPFIEKDRGIVPLSFILAWIKIESDGVITVVPKYAPGTKDLDERGYFQISIEESEKQGFQHWRLSYDPAYSVQAGIKLINYYANAVRALGVSDSNPIFWRFVKFWHAASGIATYAVRFAKEKNLPLYDWEAFKKFILETAWNDFEKRIEWFKSNDKKAFVIRLLNNVDKLFQWASLIQPAISS
jgi:hypothetical protein